MLPASSLAKNTRTIERPAFSSESDQSRRPAGKCIALEPRSHTFALSTMNAVPGDREDCLGPIRLSARIECQILRTRRDVPVVEGAR